jgi:hypothetical protein
LRITVGTVLLEFLRVGALDGGFVAGGRDAEGVPVIHVAGKAEKW